MSDTPNSRVETGPTRTRALFERLATTSHRRSLTADRIFRQLRKEDEAKERARRGRADD